MPIFIGIAGKAGSGKTTLANAIQRNVRRRGKCVIIPFALPLKQICMQMGWDGKKDTRGRRLLQIVGTDAARNCISEDVWIDKWLELVRKSKEIDFHTIVIAPDIRFVNEVNVIAAQKYYHLIKVTGRKYEDVPTHESEQDLPNDLFTHQFHNDKGIKDLNAFAKGLVDYGLI